MHEVAPAAGAKEPAAHAVHALAPSAENEPAAQGLQTVSAVAVPGVEAKEPGGHTVKGVQAAVPALVEKEPDAQGRHAAPPPGENLPGAQGEETVLEVAVQAAETPLPGGLDEQAMHADWPDTDA